MSHTRQSEEPPDEENSAEGESLRQRRRRMPLREGTTDLRDVPFIDVPEDVPILDFSPASTAINPSDAKQDLGAAYAVGRFDYTPNATYTDEELPAKSEAAVSLNQFNREQDSNSDEDMESPRRETDLRRDIEGWGHQIGLTKTEIHEAAAIVDATPTGVRRNFGLEAVCLGALTIAANQPTHGEHTAKSIRLCGVTTNNPQLVENYEQLKGDVAVATSVISAFRAWYNRTNS